MCATEPRVALVDTVGESALTSPDLNVRAPFPTEADAMHHVRSLNGPRVLDVVKMAGRVESRAPASPLANIKGSLNAVVVTTKYCSYRLVQLKMYPAHKVYSSSKQVL